MTIETVELEKRVEKLEKLITRLTTGKAKNWVKVSTIQQLTGWNKEQLRSARKNGLVIAKRDKEGFWYLLESLNPVFIKH